MHEVCTKKDEKNKNGGMKIILIKHLFQIFAFIFINNKII